MALCLLSTSQSTILLDKAAVHQFYDDSGLCSTILSWNQAYKEHVEVRFMKIHPLIFDNHWFFLLLFLFSILTGVEQELEEEDLVDDYEDLYEEEEEEKEEDNEDEYINVTRACTAKLKPIEQYTMQS